MHSTQAEVCQYETLLTNDNMLPKIITLGLFFCLRKALILGYKPHNARTHLLKNSSLHVDQSPCGVVLHTSGARRSRFLGLF